MTNETKTYAITEAERALLQKVVDAAISSHFVSERPVILEAHKLLQSLPLITGEPVSRQKILGAIGRAWCHQDNAHKVLDESLSFAVCKEIQALDLYTHPQPLQPKEQPL